MSTDVPLPSPPQPPKYVPKNPPTPPNPLFTGPKVPKNRGSSRTTLGLGFSVL